MRIEDLEGHHVQFAPNVTLGLSPVLAGRPLIERVEATFARNPPRFQDIAELELDRGPIAICGAGPSLNEFAQHMQAVWSHHPIMVCGTAHDHAVQLGIKPRYAVIFDPQPIAVKSLRQPQQGCTYLVASICDASVFDTLDGQDIRVWHPAGSVELDHYRGECAVTGGSSVTLRAMVLAFLLGHREQHLFGFDCCYGRTTHAFGDHGDTTRIPIEYDGYHFTTNLSLIEQAFEFIQQVQLYGDKFYPIVYGDGLAARLMVNHGRAN